MDNDKSSPGSSKTSEYEIDFSNIKPEDKLRVLCLHGYRQNGEFFKLKIGAFKKFINKYAELVFVTAPHQTPPLEGASSKATNNNNRDEKSWWFNKSDGTFKGTNIGGPAIGFDESLKLVESVWKEQGPFQGLLGFSQGACFVGLICGLTVKGLTSIKPNFAIMASGFVSGSLVHKNSYEDNVTFPSLHIYGENDDIIPAEMSENLILNFDNPTILTHSGGHYFPGTSHQKQTYVDFFRERLREHIKRKYEINTKQYDEITFMNNLNH